MAELRIHDAWVERDPAPPELRIHDAWVERTPAAGPSPELRIHDAWVEFGLGSPATEGGVWVWNGTQHVKHRMWVWNGTEHV